MDKLVIKMRKELSLGAHTYKVAFDRSIRDDDHAGILMRRRQRIVIDPTLPDTEKVEAFFHEAAHWVCEVWGVDAPEGDVSRLGEGLAEFFVRNFGLEFDWGDIEEVVHE